MFRSFRLIIPAALVAVLAACSVPFPEQTENLGLGLEAQRIVMRPPGRGLMVPAQADTLFEGSITVTANKVEDRLTLTALEIPIELVGDVQIVPGDALDGVTTLELRDFTISFSVSDGTNSVNIGELDLPVIVTLDLVEASGDWEFDAGADTFSLFVLAGAMGQVNDIITGNPSESFTFTANVSFTADVPEELIEISFVIADGPAKLKGKVKVV